MYCLLVIMGNYIPTGPLREAESLYFFRGHYRNITDLCILGRPIQCQWNINIMESCIIEIEYCLYFFIQTQQLLWFDIVIFFIYSSRPAQQSFWFDYVFFVFLLFCFPPSLNLIALFSCCGCFLCSIGHVWYIGTSGVIPNVHTPPICYSNQTHGNALRIFKQADNTDPSPLLRKRSMGGAEGRATDTDRESPDWETNTAN